MFLQFLEKQYSTLLKAGVDAARKSFPQFAPSVAPETDASEHVREERLEMLAKLAPDDENAIQSELQQCWLQHVEQMPPDVQAFLPVNVPSEFSRIHSYAAIARLLRRRSTSADIGLTQDKAYSRVSTESGTTLAAGIQISFQCRSGAHTGLTHASRSRHFA